MMDPVKSHRTNVNGTLNVLVACREAGGSALMLQQINAITGNDIFPIYAEARSGDIKHSQADISHAKTQLGYEPRVSFLEGLERTIEWYRPTARVTRMQTRQSLFQKSTLPATDVAAVATQGLAYGAERLALGKHQNQTSTTDVISSQRLRTHSASQFLFHFPRQFHFSDHHDPKLCQQGSKRGPNFAVTGH
jgi:hypothetical protein